MVDKASGAKDFTWNMKLSGGAGAAIAQCVIFGIFGIDARFGDGEGVAVSPHPPKFAARMALRGVRIRGEAFDVAVDGGQFEVRAAGGSVRAPAGGAVLVRGGKAVVMDAVPPVQW